MQIEIRSPVIRPWVPENVTVLADTDVTLTAGLADVVTGLYWKVVRRLAPYVGASMDKLPEEVRSDVKQGS